MRRKGPEELLDDGGPLFSSAPKAPKVEPRPAPTRGEKLAQVEARAETARNAAAARASRIDKAWKAEALAAIRAHALTHETFLLEEVGLTVPEGSDPRATGAVVRAAVGLGWIKREGFAAAVTSNGSAKALWSSRLWKRA